MSLGAGDVLDRTESVHAATADRRSPIYVSAERNFAQADCLLNGARVDGLFARLLVFLPSLAPTALYCRDGQRSGASASQRQGARLGEQQRHAAARRRCAGAARRTERRRAAAPTAVPQNTAGVA